jgi:phosphatidylserine/phosphatidylglycerophosphate/cardiolipin synthase-like enzyme
VVEGPFFGPECPLDGVMERYIRAAQWRLRLAFYKLTWSPLIDLLVQAATRGVNVSVFTGTFAYAGTLKNDALLRLDLRQFHPARAAGNGSTLFHHKVMLVDDDIVLMGSVNAMKKSLRTDSEDLTVFRSRQLAARFDDLCESHRQFKPARLVPCGQLRPTRAQIAHFELCSLGAL